MFSQPLASCTTQDCLSQGPGIHTSIPLNVTIKEDSAYYLPVSVGGQEPNFTYRQLANTDNTDQSPLHFIGTSVLYPTLGLHFDPSEAIKTQDNVFTEAVTLVRVFNTGLETPSFTTPMLYISFSMFCSGKDFLSYMVSHVGTNGCRLSCVGLKFLPVISFFVFSFATELIYFSI